MRHGADFATNEQVPPALRAKIRLLKRRWSHKRKTWKYVYCIWGPDALPCLPSDAALATILDTVSGVRLIEVHRFPNRDYAEVTAYAKSLLSTRARGQLRTSRIAMLTVIGAACTQERDVPEHVQVACEEFYASTTMVRVVWHGIRLSAYSPEGFRYDSGSCLTAPWKSQFRMLYRICKPILPFTHEAAHT